MRATPRVVGRELFLPATPQFLPAARAVSAKAVMRKFPDSNYPAWIPVPHTPDMTLVINRIAQTSIPGPALAFWEYPGFRAPFFHQRLTVDFLTQHRRAYCLNDMGSGKTSSVLWATEFLRKCGEINRTLILSPLSTLRVVWVDELVQVRPGVHMAVAHGSAEKRRQALYESTAPYVVSNHDMLRLEDPVKLGERFDHIVVDEFGVFRTWNSGSMPQRYKNLLKLAHHPNVKRFWGLTGTPTPNGPFDAWALIKLMDPAFKTTKTAFQMQTMKQITDFKWVPKPGAAEHVSKLMQPAIRFSKEEVMKYLPDKVFTTREVNMTAEQARMRDKIRKELVAEFNGKEVNAANAAVLLGKCLQISSGSVKASDEDGEPVHLPYGPRFSELLSLIEQTQAKTLVFCSYTAPVKRLTKDLNAKGISTAAVWGGVAQGKRTEIYRAFQNEPEPRVLVAHPGTTAHGITLTAADLIVWFGPTFNAEWYEQANNRAHRPGQKRVVTIAHLVSTPEERAVYRTLRERGEMQDTILNLAKEML